jgi:hypothetical protein
MRFRGKIVRGDQVVLPVASGTIDESISLSGTRVIEGNFTYSGVAGIVVGNDFNLVLTDGRKAGLRIVGTVDDGKGKGQRIATPSRDRHEQNISNPSLPRKFSQFSRFIPDTFLPEWPLKKQFEAGVITAANLNAQLQEILKCLPTD